MLEDKVKHLIDKHQNKANKYHEIAKTFHKHGLREFTVNADRKAHEHEVFALELRMILK